ncbi:MAG TPA: UvrB/UvrC motif-containing protein [Clostridia bacterium]|nr:UvrB/UvrC motif-containing protein [Clostridia bacterium]
MLCQNCQAKLANVHLTQSINGKKAELYLCEECAKEKGHIGFGSQLSLNDFFNGLIGYESANPYMNSTEINHPECKKCGMSYEEFQKTGKLGCDNCYEVFGERLKPLLKRLHGSIEHNGKVPEKVSKIMKTTVEIEELRGMINEAVQKEEYERAAVLRDQIRVLEAKNVGEG